MSPMKSFSRDDVNKLPSVPRIRRSSGAKPPVPRGSRSGTSIKRHSFIAEKKPVIPSSRQRIGRKGPQEEFVSSEEDGNDPSHFVVQRASLRTQKIRKVIEDDDCDEDDEDAVNNSRDVSCGEEDILFDVGMTGDEDEDDLRDDDADQSKSVCASISRMKQRNTMKENSSESRNGGYNYRRDGDDNEDRNYLTNDSEDGEGNEIIKGHKQLFVQFMRDGDNDSESFSSIWSEDLKPTKPKRLTRRQRAMQGEDIKLDYSQLNSTKTKKKVIQQEDWDHDEEMELKRQQKARLRQMVSEKRNREKRAAMVDKVLKGVTSKRKKFTLATEARAAQVEVRLTQNEMRAGCIRYVSNKNGSTLSIPKDTNVPAYLNKSLKASYPPICKRDPKTGKRVLPHVSTLTATK